MKKTITMVTVLVLFFGVNLLNPLTANSQVSFLIGMGAGYILGSGGDEYGNGGATILYVAPRLQERITDVLAIRQVSVGGDFSRFDAYFKAKSLRSLFMEAMKKSGEKGFRKNSGWENLEDKNLGNYEIIQVVRVFSGANPDVASIWFAFIEKTKLIPLKDLPQKK